MFDSSDKQVSSAEVAVFLSLSVLTVVLNAFVLIITWKDPFKNLKGIPNYLILNLAVTDLFVGIPAQLLLTLLHWYPYKSIVQVRDITLVLGFYASGLTVMGLAVERLIVISNPLKSADYVTYSNLRRGIFCIWFVAGLIAFLPAFDMDAISRTNRIINDSLGILILILTVACYARIFFLVRKGSHRASTSEAGGCEERQRLTENAREKEKIKRRERIVMRCVAILVGLLIVCWAPCIVLANIKLCGKNCCVNPDALRSTANGLICLRQLVHPIAYSMCTKKFRQALWKVICKCNSTSLR